MGETLLCPHCAKLVEGEPNYCPACGTDLRGLSATGATLSGPMSGALIGGRYQVLEKLGEGGMGAVFKVEHVRMGKILALKLLRPDAARDKRIVGRFRQEARVIAKLTHPNTVQVFDSGALDDGSLYLAMEYLPGRDLAWHLRARGAMNEETALSIAIQLLASLEEAHAQGVVHRDLKPANVMLVRRKGQDDLVKLLDFGVAKLVETEAKKHQTGANEVVGTPAYMAPEQAMGEAADARTDLYALGAMLFELVSGRPVFVGANPMSVVQQHLSAPVPRLAEVCQATPPSAAFEAAVRKALEKAPAQRFQSAEQMRTALERVRREQGGLPADFTPMPEDLTGRLANRDDFDRFERNLRTRRVVAPVAAVAITTLVLGGAALSLRSTPSSLTEEREPNDEPERASPLALGTTSSGTMGAREASASHGDRDLFVVEVPAGPVSVELTGVNDLNLKVELLQPKDGRLGRLAFLDDQGTGAGERLDGVEAQKGPLYLRIEEGPFVGEANRPPRERALVRYHLTVSATPAEGPHESEPNDAPVLAHRAPWTRSVLAWAGAKWPYPGPALANGTAPALDWFQVDAPDHDTVAALVVPNEGRLLAVDGAQLEAWESKGSQGKPPRAWAADGAPVLIRLSAAQGVRKLRVQSDGAAPGTPYRVAFLTSGANGLAAALDLARTLELEGKKPARRQVVELAAGAFDGSPQLAELKALLERE